MSRIDLTPDATTKTWFRESDVLIEGQVSEFVRVGDDGGQVVFRRRVIRDCAGCHAIFCSTGTEVAEELTPSSLSKVAKEVVQLG